MQIVGFPMGAHLFLHAISKTIKNCVYVAEMSDYVYCVSKFTSHARARTKSIQSSHVAWCSSTSLAFTNDLS